MCEALDYNVPAVVVLAADLGEAVIRMLWRGPGIQRN